MEKLDSIPGVGKFFGPRAVLNFFGALRAIILENLELQMTFYMNHKLIRLKISSAGPTLPTPVLNKQLGPS